MADKPALACVALLLACAVTACGQKGPLYLPEAQGEVVTRPAATPSGNTEAPNSPQTPDSPPAPASPAPEVTAPEEKKDKDAATQPPPK